MKTPSRLSQIEARLAAVAPQDCWAGFLVKNFMPGDIEMLRHAPDDLTYLLARVRRLEAALERIAAVDVPSVSDKTAWIVMLESVCLHARKALGEED